MDFSRIILFVGFIFYIVEKMLVFKKNVLCFLECPEWVQKYPGVKGKLFFGSFFPLVPNVFPSSSLEVP
jgi:hypothetical protein